MSVEYSITHENGLFRTSGLQALGCLDIEIKLPLEEGEGFNICNQICLKIVEGLKIEDGLFVEDVVCFDSSKRRFVADAFFIKVKCEDGEERYRVVLSDENGNYPWDISNRHSCSEEYRGQIEFDKDKVFFMEFLDCDRVEEIGTAFPSTLNGFEKAGDRYVNAFQYICVAPDGKWVLVYTNRAISRFGFQHFYKTMQEWYGLDNFRVICKDVDETDPINQSYLSWKRM